MWGNCVWLGEERGEGGGGIGRAGELSTWAHQNVISPNYRENIREIVSLTLANDNSFSIHYYNYLLQHLLPLFFQPPKCSLLLSFLNHMVCLFVIKKRKRKKEVFVKLLLFFFFNIGNIFHYDVSIFLKKKPNCYI